jgi:hypothetical protein
MSQISPNSGTVPVYVCGIAAGRLATGRDFVSMGLTDCQRILLVLRKDDSAHGRRLGSEKCRGRKIRGNHTVTSQDRSGQGEGQRKEWSFESSLSRSPPGQDSNSRIDASRYASQITYRLSDQSDSVSLSFGHRSREAGPRKFHRAPWHHPG